MKLLHSFGKFTIKPAEAGFKPKIGQRTLHHPHQIKEPVLGEKT